MSANNGYKSISQSSFLNLKAELLKKKASLQQPSSGSLYQDPYSSTKSKVSSFHVESIQPLQVNKKTAPLEASLNEKIQTSLNTKAAKYRKLLLESTYEDYEPSGDDFLVDFSRMPVDDTERLLSRLTKEEEDREEGMNPSNFQHLLAFDEPLEEILDEFGRTRMVPRHEAIRMKYELEHAQLPTQLLGDSATQEEHRPIQDVHYSEDFEIRTKSVFFYKFSANEEMRQEQMKALRALDSLSEAQRLAVQQARKLNLDRQTERKEVILSKRKEFMPMLSFAKT